MSYRKEEILENLKTEYGHSLLQIIRSWNEFLTKTVKNFAKVEVKVFCTYLILLDFFTFGQVL